MTQPAAAGALDGIRVLDLTRALAGPYCTLMLGDHGADVIKVEMPGTGDETRDWAPPSIQGISAYYLAINRNKRSVTVDLKNPDGKRVLERLIERCDVVVENFSPGTLARLGFPDERVRAINPGSVLCHISGFGQDGPGRAWPAYDLIVQGMGGIMSLTGERGGGPVKPGLPVADLTSGLWVAVAILAALAGRTRTGKGCHVDFSMLDGQVALLTLAAARYFALGEVPPRLGTEHPGRVPSASLRCKDGKYAHITASDQHWAPLCKALDLEEWGKTFPTNEIRVERREEIMAVLNRKISQMERSRLLATLDAADVPVGPVNDVAEILADPHVRARRLVGSFDYPEVGEFKALALPYKFLGWDNPEIGRPPLLGEHTEQILAELKR